MIQLRCNICGHLQNYNPSVDYHDDNIVCDKCFSIIPLNIIEIENKYENTVVGPTEVFENGTIIRVDQHTQPWHGDIGIVRAYKPFYYRVEIRSKLLWLPWQWIKLYESFNVDD
jgi:hypothetical protein